MSFWSITAKRSVNFNRTYIIMGAVISIYGIIISNILTLLPTNTANLASTSSVDLKQIFPFLSIALLALSALIFATPVILLFVYDKNNGVFEYLLSTGLDQSDIFKGYLKASLGLAILLLSTSSVVNFAVEAYLGTQWTLMANISVLTLAIGISVVSIVTVAMMAFSSLQKNPSGANQPLGIILGVVPILPSLLLPLVLPSLATVLELAIAAMTILISIGLLLSAGKLILREKLLP
jgi:hypothetical protein